MITGSRRAAHRCIEHTERAKCDKRHAPLPIPNS